MTAHPMQIHLHVFVFVNATHALLAACAATDELPLEPERPLCRCIGQRLPGDRLNWVQQSTTLVSRAGTRLRDDGPAADC
jgi:hypothetical protein